MRMPPWCRSRCGSGAPACFVPLAAAGRSSRAGIPSKAASTRGRGAPSTRPTDSSAAGACGSQTVYSFCAAALRRVEPAGAARDPTAPRLLMAVVLGHVCACLLWLMTFLNIFGFSAGKWVQHIGSIGQRGFGCAPDWCWCVLPLRCLAARPRRAVAAAAARELHGHDEPLVVAVLCVFGLRDFVDGR